MKNFNLDKILIASGFIGPIIFFLTTYFLFALMFPGYNPAYQYISELGAVDSPIKTVANVFGFSLFGIFIMLFAYGLFRSKEIRNVGKVASFFFFLTGILMFLVGVFSCDAGCFNISMRGGLHEKVSNYQFPILAIGLILLAFDIIMNKKIRWLAAPILVLGGIILVLAYFFLISHQLFTYPGILQRAAIGLSYLLVMIIAITLYKKTEFNRKI